MNGVQKTIWQTRPDLRALCGDDPSQLEYWLIVHGRREYRGLESSLFTVHRTMGPSGLTLLQEYLWHTRPDLQPLFDIATPEGRDGFQWWYFIHGVAELDLSGFVTPEQQEFLNEPDPGVFQDAPQPITRLMMALWRRRPDLQATHLLQTPAGRKALVEWFFTTGREETGYGALFDELIARLTKKPAAPAILQPREPLAQGVNLIGFARGEFGIGEDVRMAALSCAAASIPFSIYNIEPGSGVSQGDRSAEAHISSKLPHAVNLFCMTGIDTALLAATAGSNIFADRRNIGFWPWELPHWPAEWRHAYDLVDEIWASSRYTYNAYAESSPKPVRHLPMAVTVEPTEGIGREAFALPRDKFLFVFSFDGLSGFARKNPLACIEAFRQAFPHGDREVGLVLKAMRHEVDSAAWLELTTAAEQDRRIFLITETFTRGRLLDLYRASNCFVSLHRAEGFGRCIAEAMMLGKPVIVTGYSGNLDFTTLGTAALVDHQMRHLSAGDYPFGERQSWAEPSIDHATWWMRRVVADDRMRSRLARVGRNIVVESYSPFAVGQEYGAALTR